MNKNLIQEIKGINADLIQGRKENELKKTMIETMANDMTTNDNKFIDINDTSTYNNYKLLTTDKKNSRDILLSSFIEKDKEAKIGLEFQLNRGRIREFAKNYGGRFIKINNAGPSDGNIYYITKFGDAIKKNGGINNISKSCNKVPVNINFEYLENYKYNKYLGNYLISTSGGMASKKTDATIIKVLDHTMAEFHPCGMEDSFVYVGLNKDRDYRHGLIVTNSNSKHRDFGCYNDNVKLGPRTIIENKTLSECAVIASRQNSTYASARVGKYSKNEIASSGINDYSYNKDGVKYYGIKNSSTKRDGRTTGQCILISNDLDSKYRYYKWRGGPEYLGCWGDWFDTPWGLKDRNRAMGWLHRGRKISFNECKKGCKSRGYDIWGLQYAKGNADSGQCMCGHESQKHKWQKYGGANNCKWDKRHGVNVGGAWSTAVYKSKVNPRPHDTCSQIGATGNIINFREAEQFQENNLGKNAYIDRESISHDLSKSGSKRIFFLNNAINENTQRKGCSINSEKHYEISSKEWESLRKNTGKPRTCNEKQTVHDLSKIDAASKKLFDVTQIVERRGNIIQQNIDTEEKKIIGNANNISIKSKQAGTILNALKTPITSGFTNLQNNNLNNITNMVNDFIKNIIGKESIIEGHANTCHDGDGDSPCGIPVGNTINGHVESNHGDEYKNEIKTMKILMKIQKYFTDGPTFDAQRDFTLLDVSSKKQWLYIWGLLIISILSFKFYIIAKK